MIHLSGQVDISAGVNVIVDFIIKSDPKKKNFDNEVEKAKTKVLEFIKKLKMSGSAQRANEQKNKLRTAFEKLVDDLLKSKDRGELRLEGKVCESCGKIHEGSCGYTHTAGGKKLRTPGGTNDPAVNKIREYIKESLRNWFKKEKWVRIDTQGNIAGKCGTMPKGKATQRCLPRAKANSLTKKQRAATARKKVRGSKKGKQFVKNTKKATVRLKKKK